MKKNKMVFYNMLLNKVMWAKLVFVTPISLLSYVPYAQIITYYNYISSLHFSPNFYTLCLGIYKVFFTQMLIVHALVLNICIRHI